MHDTFYQCSLRFYWNKICLLGRNFRKIRAKIERTNVTE